MVDIKRKYDLQLKDLKTGRTFEIVNHLDYRDKVLLKLICTDSDKYNAVDLATGQQHKIQDHIYVREVLTELNEL